jgi:hypothetical protein
MPAGSELPRRWREGQGGLLLGCERESVGEATGAWARADEDVGTTVESGCEGSVQE